MYIPDITNQTTCGTLVKKNATKTDVSDSLITWMPCLKSSLNSTNGVMPNFCFSSAASFILASRTDLSVAISSSSYKQDNNLIPFLNSKNNHSANQSLQLLILNCS